MEGEARSGPADVETALEGLDRRVDDRKLGALYGVGRKKVKIADAETIIAGTG